MNDLGNALVTVLVAIVGVAIIAVLVSRNSQTSAVLRAFGSAFSSILEVAVKPVAGGGGGSYGISSPPLPSQWSGWGGSVGLG